MIHRSALPQAASVDKRIENSFVDFARLNSILGMPLHSDHIEVRSMLKRLNDAITRLSRNQQLFAQISDALVMTGVHCSNVGAESRPQPGVSFKYYGMHCRELTDTESVVVPFGVREMLIQGAAKEDVDDLHPPAYSENRDLALV